MDAKEATPAVGARGWKLVPVEPTPYMVKAGAQGVDDCADAGKDVPFERTVSACYRAMLAAAPPALTAPAPDLLQEARDVTRIVKDWFAVRNLGPSADAMQYSLQEMLAKLDAALVQQHGDKQ